MKRFLLVVLALGVLSFAATNAFAGDIVLNQNNGYGTNLGFAVDFTGTDGGNAFNLNFTGHAFGQAVGFGNLAGNGVYTIIQLGGVSVSYNGVSCGAGCYSLNQVGNLTFDYGTAKGNGSLLTGFLQLLNVTQTGTTGNFNDTLMVNLIIKGGTLASKFSTGNGIVELTLAFKSATSLAGLMTGQTLGAWINSGTVNPQAVPEPPSLLVLGVGLLGFAGLTRIKRLSIG